MHPRHDIHDVRTLSTSASRIGNIALVVGVLAVLIGFALAFIFGAAGDAAHVDHHAGVHGWALILRAYLWAFMFITTISLGGLFFTIIHFATKAGWSTGIRRIAELLAGNLRWLGIGFIPILLGMWFSENTHLYEWAIPSVIAHDEVLHAKAGYLNPAFWTIRAVIYFLIWGWLSQFFLTNSLRQDQSGDPGLTLRMQSMSYPAILLFGLSVTFASIDWIMALEPHWFSTMFGVYFFAGSACGFFATFIIACWLLQRGGMLRETVTPEHYQDMGKLLFAFGIVFWAYIGFSQFMLIWYGNIPEETTWFMIRQLGGWVWVSLLLIIGHFFVPFLGIISRHPKRYPVILAIAAGWMLLMHLVDLYWLIMPRVPIEAIQAAPDMQSLKEEFADLPINFHWAHIVFLLGFIGLAAGFTLWTMHGRSLVPVRDPRLHEALAFENM